MSTRNIVEIGNATLRKKSKPVVDFDENLGQLFDDMLQTMKEKNSHKYINTEINNNTNNTNKIELKTMCMSCGVEKKTSK